MAELALGGGADDLGLAQLVRVSQRVPIKVRRASPQWLLTGMKVEITQALVDGTSQLQVLGCGPLADFKLVDSATQLLVSAPRGAV